MRNLEGSSSSIAPVGPLRSPWHSPVPYLFGGLAAMLGLIAFALLILACSYWKLSGNLEENQEGDLEEGNNNNNNDSNGGDGKMVEPPILEEKFLVIMAGQLKPTYIATPSLSSRASSFGSNSGCTASSESSTDKSEAEEKEEEGNNVSGSSLENREETLVGEREKEVSNSSSENNFVVNVTQIRIS